jgi:hypothetical protein
MKALLQMAATCGLTGLLAACGPPPPPQEAPPAPGFAAVADEKGGLDITGPYEVVPGWPKPLSALPGHENWTWGAVQGVFAENPNRVYMVQRGELPAMQRPAARPLPEVGPGLSFPVGQAPFRNASQGPASSPPGAGGPGADPDDPKQAWMGRMGIDARWEHTIVVFNAAGDIIEQWTQWDKMMRRPHAVYVNPWDAEKHVWIVDDHSHAIFKFSNDGKTLLQTIGTPNQKGADGAHFNRPTFMAFLPDSSFFVADANNALCEGAAGQNVDLKDTVEKGVTSKAGLIAALRDSFAKCKAVYDPMTDAAAAKPVPFGKGTAAAATLLSFAVSHANEHYGNLVTYMRLNNIVPPSSRTGDTR